MEPCTATTGQGIILSGFGGYEKMCVKDCDVPELGEGDVLVQMRACGMNFSDIYTRQGIYTFKGVAPPFVMGIEGSGDVINVGSDVRSIKVGDRVVCWSFTYGMWSTFAKVPEVNCCIMPDDMSYQEGAAIPVNYATAYLTLYGIGGLKRGQKVLVQSAAGGVGWAATQLCHIMEDVTVFGTSSPSKFGLTQENGVNHPIDYRTKDFVQEVLNIEPKGVDIILDCLSGNDFARSRQLLRPLGHIVHVGISNMISGEKRSAFHILRTWWQTKNVSVLELVNSNQCVCGFNLATFAEANPEETNSTVNSIIQMYSAGKIKPRIDSEWKFEEIRSATEHMLNRKNIGKQILLPP
ncbi:synaptic vesicle membrane protein VAT-1 homolog [Ornithodoros turicata]|uniref:synaptic vesicle membrane protein VAT-1 homolog n=1 Tax=Ornithodoros turicata TaxID=34597 RepID=UPI003138E25B